MSDKVLICLIVCSTFIICCLFVLIGTYLELKRDEIKDISFCGISEQLKTIRKDLEYLKKKAWQATRQDVVADVADCMTCRKE